MDKLTKNCVNLLKDDIKLLEELIDNDIPAVKTRIELSLPKRLGIVEDIRNGRGVKREAKYS